MYIGVNLWEAKLMMGFMNISCLGCVAIFPIGEYIMISKGLLMQGFQTGSELLNIGFAVLLIWIFVFEYCILMFYPYTCFLGITLPWKLLARLE